MSKISDERLADTVLTWHYDNPAYFAVAIFPNGERLPVDNLREQSRIETTYKAALQSLRSQPAGVRVKGLEWHGVIPGRLFADIYMIERLYMDDWRLFLRANEHGDWPKFLAGPFSLEKAKAAAEADYRQRILSALEPQQEEAVAVERWRQNSIDTWAAMTAMRNSINEHIPMPSIEGDLLQGPENSVFCAAVADAVVAYVARTNSLLESALYFVEEKYEPAIDSEHALHQQLRSRTAHPTPAQKVQESQTGESPWRTMDTAPLDGRNCILAVPEPGGFIYSVQGAYQDGQWNVVHRENVKPLYWMPNVRLPKGWDAALESPHVTDQSGDGK